MQRRIQRRRIQRIQRIQRMRPGPVGGPCDEAGDAVGSV